MEKLNDKASYQNWPKIKCTRDFTFLSLLLTTANGNLDTNQLFPTVFKTCASGLQVVLISYALHFVRLHLTRLYPMHPWERVHLKRMGSYPTSEMTDNRHQLLKKIEYVMPPKKQQQNPSNLLQCAPKIS